MHASSRCCQGSALGSCMVCSVLQGVGDTNSRSCCTTSLNRSSSLVVVAEAGDGSFHMRQGRQVSTISSTCLIAFSGAPAVCSMRRILVAGTCHHLMCSARSVLRTTPGFLDRKSCMLCPRSQADQSTPVWSACTSACLMAGPLP